MGLFAMGIVLLLATPASAVVLWNDPDATLVHENGAGADILGGALKRDDSANDTLYFKFHVDLCPTRTRRIIPPLLNCLMAT